MTDNREALRLIAEDMAADAKAFWERPFTGAVVGEALGNMQAAIARIAEIVAEMQSPQASVDYLPPVSEPAKEILAELNNFAIGEGGQRHAEGWLRVQPEVAYVRGFLPAPDHRPEAELHDGTLIVWSHVNRHWEIAVGKVA